MRKSAKKPAKICVKSTIWRYFCDSKPRMESTDELLSEIAELKAQNEVLKHERDSYQHQSERVNAMLNSYHGSIWHIDKNYCVLECNRYLEEEMGYYHHFVPEKGEPIFGKKGFDSEAALFWKKNYDIALQGNIHIFDFPVKSPTGKRIHECHFFPSKDEKGNVIGVYCFKEDITQRKEIESLMLETQEKLSMAHQVAKLGMWTLCFETEAIHLSKEMQVMLELDPPYFSPLVMSISEYQAQFVQGVSRTKFSESVLNIQENKHNIGYEDKYEYNLRSAKGNELIIFVRRKVVQQCLIEGLSQDITEFRTIEREHAQLTNNLLQKVKDSEQFTYIVSHNLRSPVARLLGLTSIFQTESPNSEHNSFVVKTIEKVAGQLDTVIKDLNSILSLKNDRQEDLEVLHLATLLENVKEFVGSDIEKSAATVNIDVSRTPEILAIPSYAHSIFTNFLTNAIKYKHPDRPPIISITSFPTAKYIRIDVSDNGIGMDLEKVKARLFSPFSRFHAESKIEGKGLGLFLVKTQIEAMGGKIEIQSNVGVGTTFFVYFPLPAS